MNLVQTTPVPNVIFDVYIKDLQGSELKILLVIIRYTLGWKDLQGYGGRKSRDWISTTQIEKKAGLSRRAISAGLANLIKNGFIRITNEEGFDLISTSDRKGKTKLYYELTLARGVPVDNEGNTGLNPFLSCKNSTEITKDISKNVQALTQKMRTTK